MRPYLEVVIENLSCQMNGLYGLVNMMGEDTAIFAESAKEREQAEAKIDKIKEATMALDDTIAKLQEAHRMEVQR